MHGFTLRRLFVELVPGGMGLFCVGAPPPVKTVNSCPASQLKYQWISWESGLQEYAYGIEASIISSNRRLARTGDAGLPRVVQTTGVPAARKTTCTLNRVLIADDDPQVRKLFARKLRSAGYSVSEAKTGAEAVILLRGMRFRLLVLDLDMPDTDGFGVLKTVRSEFPYVQVLVVSGYMQGVLLRAAECFGAVGTLEKPAAAQDLLEAARRVLGDD